MSNYPLFADELILYISRSTKFYQKTRNNKFSNVRIQNQLVCAHTYTLFYTQQTCREIMDTFLFTIASKKLKYLGINSLRK